MMYEKRWVKQSPLSDNHLTFFQRCFVEDFLSEVIPSLEVASSPSSSDQ